MTKILTILLLFCITLLAYNDYDIDGVEDRNDKCPDTPILELVSMDGCSIKSLASPHHFDLIYGFDFYQTNYDTLEDTNTISQSLQLDYYYKNFSLQLSSAYYNSNSITYNDSGANDSFVGAYYKLTSDSTLIFRIGVGAIIPTYDSDLNNNNTDYTASLNVSYPLKSMNIFGGYSHTLINDDDIPTEGIEYQNTHAYNVGLGFYPTNKFYLSTAYNSSNSIYTEIDDIDTASIYGLYSIDENWFLTLNYAYGISDSASDNFASLRVGYYF